MVEIDLHTHSTISDGTLTPAELVTLAHEIDLRALALTDHDTVLGLDEACRTGQDLGVEVIGGCELSVDCPQGSMHILGLWLPARPTRLQAALDHLISLRRERNEAIIANLNRCGVDISYEELEAESGGGTIGRPHFARLLVKRGNAVNLEEAFMRWLRPGTKGYAPKQKLSPRVAIELLKSEGATVILAHPSTLHLGEEALEAEIRRLKDFGLDGMEVFYSMHTQAQTNKYAALSCKLDLLQSAGSDFHGSNKPNISLGRGKGGLRPSYRLVELMKARRSAQGLTQPSCS